MDEFGVFFWSKTEMWDSLLKKCVVTDCKLEKHKLPLIDHKLSKTVESGDSPDSVESLESLCLEGEGALRLKLGQVQIPSGPHTVLRTTYAFESPRAEG